jgi:histidinol-phosphatase
MCHSTAVALVDDPEKWSEDLAFAHEMAQVASTIALNHFGSSSSHIKADGTPVGQADLEVDKVLSDMIRAAYPEDRILSEESPSSGTASRRWILDPVDGTVQFLAGEHEWGTHIALEENGEVVLGIVTRPVLGQVWWGFRGGGSWSGTPRDDQVIAAERLHVSDIHDLSESRVTVWPVEQHSELVARVKAVVRWTEPDTRCVLRLLQGDFEAVCAFAGGPWDHAPAVVLVEEAGGRFCDPAGGRRLDLGGACYTNGRIDGELQALLRPNC